MPYIPPDQRREVEPTLAPLCDRLRGSSAGTLNYAITRLVLSWLGDAPRYENYNAAIGVLACAQTELYRERIAPYEDKAKVVNGPVRTPRYDSEP